AMRLTFENNLLTIAVTSPDVDEATDTVTIKYDGPSITTIFNPEFMLVPLTNLTSDEITIELNNASSPGLIKDETTFLYLIMPLRV
ncbi:MAG: DNA polymerase III subunit beta, partial [Kiritimatiellia bacterium]